MSKGRNVPEKDTWHAMVAVVHSPAGAVCIRFKLGPLDVVMTPDEAHQLLGHLMLAVLDADKQTGTVRSWNEGL